MTVLVLDNGSYDIKVGYAEQRELISVHNAIIRSPNDRKTYIGNEINEYGKDLAGLQFRRPHEKGQLVNWEGQKAIWDHIFYGKNTPLHRTGGGVVDPSDTTLISTEMPLSLPALSSHMDQIVFEEYGFESYYRCTPASLVPWNNISQELFKTPKKGNSPVADCTLVIDSGFAATHVIPVIFGEVYWPAVKRINVGGKVLTSYLRETCSFRYYNMMSDTYIMNLVKEATCFVSRDFAQDLEECRVNKKHLLQKYILPNFQNNRGYLLPPDQLADPKDAVLNLQNERFTIPELLFNPKIIGLNQAGIPETAIRCVNDVPEEARSLLLGNVILTGGNANFKGYKDRIETELRALTPQDVVMRVGSSSTPEHYAWYGGCSLGTRPDMLQKAHVTKKDYMEHGTNLCLSKFGMKVQENVDED